MTFSSATSTPPASSPPPTAVPRQTRPARLPTWTWGAAPASRQTTWSSRPSTCPPASSGSSSTVRQRRAFRSVTGFAARQRRRHRALSFERRQLGSERRGHPGAGYDRSAPIQRSDHRGQHLERPVLVPRSQRRAGGLQLLQRPAHQLLRVTRTRGRRGHPVAPLRTPRRVSIGRLGEESPTG